LWGSQNRQKCASAYICEPFKEDILKKTIAEVKVKLFCQLSSPLTSTNFILLLSPSLPLSSFENLQANIPRSAVYVTSSSSLHFLLQNQNNNKGNKFLKT
jgi:hypothetical protein